MKERASCGTYLFELSSDEVSISLVVSRTFLNPAPSFVILESLDSAAKLSGKETVRWEA